MPLETLWISPVGFVSGSPNVNVAQINSSPAAVAITGPVGVKGWVRIGLPAGIFDFSDLDVPPDPADPAKEVARPAAENAASQDGLCGVWQNAKRKTAA